MIMNLFLTTNMWCGCVWLLDERKFENHCLRGTIQSVCRKDCMIACRSMDPNRKCMWEWSVHHDVTFCLVPSFSSELRVSDVVLVFWMCKMLIEGWVWLTLLWGVNHEILIEAFCFFYYNVTIISKIYIMSYSVRLNPSDCNCIEKNVC